jgi:hypothetical protein
MTSNLDNLVRTGQLKREATSTQELEGLIRSGLARLRDAENRSLSVDGRFDLAYNAAHALSLAALRWFGYRSDSRYLVFQTLVHTLDLPAEQWRVLSAAHQKRNHVEYEGLADIDEALVSALIRVTREVAKRVEALGPPKEE